MIGTLLQGNGKKEVKILVTKYPIFIVIIRYIYWLKLYR